MRGLWTKELLAALSGILQDALVGQAGWVGQQQVGQGDTGPLVAREQHEQRRRVGHQQVAEWKQGDPEAVDQSLRQLRCQPLLASGGVTRLTVFRGRNLQAPFPLGDRGAMGEGATLPEQFCIEWPQMSRETTSSSS